MTTPVPGNDDVTALVQSIKDNAERLGLTWKLTPATVDETPTGSQLVIVLVDGDTDVTGAFTLLGPLEAGARVMVLITAAGNYIIGRYGGTAVRRALVSSETRNSTSLLVVTVAPQDVPGIAYTLTITEPSIVKIFSSADVYCAVAGASTIILTLYIDGVAQYVFHSMLRLADDRQNPATEMSFALDPGSYSIQLHAAKSLAAGTHWVINGNSRIVVDVYS
jgi:hypothetical protein